MVAAHPHDAVAFSMGDAFATLSTCATLAFDVSKTLSADYANLVKSVISEIAKILHILVTVQETTF